MKVIGITTLLVLCSATQAITFSTIATVSLALITLNKPVECFFGIFRRRKSPPIQETIAPPPIAPPFFPNFPLLGGMMNQFPAFGAGNPFHPGLNPGFGMFGNRFPPQFKPPPTSMQKPQTIPMQQVNPQHGFPPQQQAMQPHGMQQFPPQQRPPIVIDNFNEDEAPGMNTEEAESFFTLLSETDESKCISRLVCEMGANPESGGEFGQTIVEIIGSLKDFPDGSKVSEYNEVLNIGLAEGLSSCLSKFSMCDDESFDLVKKSQLDDDGQSK